MYRLAHELEVFSLDGEVVNDPTVKNYKEKKLERLETIPEELRELSNKAREISLVCMRLRKLLQENSKAISEIEQKNLIRFEIDGEKIYIEFRDLPEAE